MGSLIDISNIDRDLLLQKLWENATNQYNRSNATFNLQIARKQFKINANPDFICGRPIKVSIYTDDKIDPYLYDRDNGDGKFQQVINSINNKNIDFTYPTHEQLQEIIMDNFEDNCKILGCQDQQTIEQAKMLYKELFN